MNDRDRARDKVLRENTAQTVWKYLEDLDNNRSAYASRWIWELIQNARDAAREDKSLVVEASISDNEFVFKHNGAPFDDEEIAHLIYYGSSKRDSNSADPIGRFGSGFLTSHLLSKRVRVNGIMHDRKRFSFVLSREGVSPHDLSRSMDRSWDDFNSSLHDAGGSSDFTTEYQYPLSEDTLPLAVSGLSALCSLAPYTLAFNAKLREIRIAQSGRTIRIWIPDDCKQDDLAYGVSLVPIRSERGGETIDRSVVIAANGEVSVAVIIDRLKGKPNVVLDSSTPRLFVAFPLFGTERFCFPAIINSERFIPQEKRDGIYLGPTQTPAIDNNKSLIESACDLYVTLLRCAGDQGWSGLHRLALLPDLEPLQWLDQSWYRQLLARKVVGPAHDTAIVVTHGGTLKSPKSALIPIEDSGVTVDEIWELSKSLRRIRELLPVQDDANGWSGVVKQWTRVLSQKTEALEESWTLEKLARRLVAARRSVRRLQATFINGQEPFEWLNQLYKLLAKAQRFDLFDELRLLPDQNGSFNSRTPLRIDIGIDEVLKDIAANLGVSARRELIDTRIDRANIPQLEEKTKEDLLSQLIQIVTAKSETHAALQPYREANVALFSWLLRRRAFDKLKGFPCLSQSTDPENHYLIKVTKNTTEPEKLPLGPPSMWPEKAREFLELFPDRFIVSQAYFDAYPDTQAWEAFATEGFIRSDPVFKSRDTEVELLAFEPLPEADSGQHQIAEPVEFSSISFLSTKNIGVIDRARGSQVKARQLLHFLAEYVVNKDQTAFDSVSVSCQCGSAHRYYRGGWLRPLWERTWVPIGEKQHGHATAESLAKLLRDESEFLRCLAQGEAAKIMQALGIGQSELLLQVGTKNETERVELVASALDLNDALGNDTTKLRKIADALRNDPQVLGDIEKVSARRAMVRRNQDIGKKVEKHLKELLEAVPTGLKVTRKHIGHDFEIENDVIDEDMAQPAEVGLEIKTKHASFLVEVKASTVDQFRMTPKQAETAVIEGTRFVLCMVQISKDSEISAEDVLSGARFVPDIGKELKDLWQDFSTLETLKQQAPRRSGDIELEIDDSKARFRIGSETWEKGMSLDEVVRFFRSAQVPSDNNTDS